MNVQTTTTHPDYRRIIDELRYRYEGVFAKESVEQAVADARAALEPLAKIPNFLPILVGRYAREQLLAAAQAEGRIVKAVPEILFICVHNAGRSQMAAALTQHLGGNKVHVRSAGSQPTGEIHPLAVEVLAEHDISLTESYPKPLTDQVVQAADVIVTMGCGDACPIYPGKSYQDWKVADPAGASIEQVRKIADDIEVRVTNLLRELDVAPDVAPGVAHGVAPGVAHGVASA